MWDLKCYGLDVFKETCNLTNLGVEDRYLLRNVVLHSSGNYRLLYFLFVLNRNYN